TLRVADDTRDRYAHALKMLPVGALAWPVADITVPTAGELFERLGERHGAWNVRKCHTALMACWREAYRNGWVAKDSNPFAGIRLPKVARSAGKLIDDIDIAKLLAVSDPGQEHTWI